MTKRKNELGCKKCGEVHGCSHSYAEYTGKKRKPTKRTVKKKPIRKGLEKDAKWILKQLRLHSPIWVRILRDYIRELKARQS